jgi:hypothetical protein
VRFADGGGSVEDQSNKMANTIDRNKKLRKTYNPVNVVSVRRFDEARAIGAKKLAEAEQNRKCHTAVPCDTSEIRNFG